MLTDGQDGDESADDLAVAVQVFECDCRGVGTDWRVEDLRFIASRLMGTVDIIPEPEDMPADFEAMISDAMGKRTVDVRLRVWVPQGATVRLVKQVSPTVEDLTTRARRLDERTSEYETGSWGDEIREYHIAIAVPAHHVGDEMAAGRVAVVVDGNAVSQSLVRAVWTADAAASTRLNHRVAHYTNQVELAAAIAEGLSARERGDETTATAKFGHAVRLASASSNTATLRLLGRVVDVLDAPTGTVRLRSSVSTADEMTLATRSTRTVRLETERCRQRTPTGRLERHRCRPRR